MYVAQLDSVEDELRRIAMELWQKLVIDPVLEYLG